jgi:hypothetical protein
VDLLWLLSGGGSLLGVAALHLNVVAGLYTLKSLAP